MPLLVTSLSFQLPLASGCFPEDDLAGYASAPPSLPAGGAAGNPADASAPAAGGAGSGGDAAGGSLSNAGNGSAGVDAGDAGASDADAGALGAGDSGSLPSFDASAALADAAP
jgi:hypothetical protein